MSAFFAFLFDLDLDLEAMHYSTKCSNKFMCWLLFSILTCHFFNAAGVPVDDRNWPPFFPVIHHDIANEIPIHAQKLQYLAFASWLGINFFP